MPRLYLLVAIAVAVTACTNGSRDDAASAPRPASGPAAAPDSIALSALPPNPGTTTPPTAGCADPTTAHIRAGETPAPRCLPVNGTLHLAAEPSPNQPWGALSTSDDTVLRCATTAQADGSITGTCTALRAGRVTLSTTTGRLPGGPIGPQQFTWQLDVTVTEPG